MSNEEVDKTHTATKWNNKINQSNSFIIYWQHEKKTSRKISLYRRFIHHRQRFTPKIDTPKDLVTPLKDSHRNEENFLLIFYIHLERLIAFRMKIWFDWIEFNKKNKIIIDVYNCFHFGITILMENIRYL